jgi:hypothetical protein
MQGRGMADMYKIMLSSTYMESKEHRTAVREAMLGQRMFPIAMEDDAALPDQGLIDASLAKVDESDGYVGLISYRYGQTPACPQRNPQRLSLTELEFRRALERDMPICMFIMHGEHPVPMTAVGAERGNKRKYESFLRIAKKDRIYAEFKSVEDLKTKAVQSLIKLREVLDRRAQRNLPDKRDSADDSQGAGGDKQRSLSGLPLPVSNISIRVPTHFMGRDEALAEIGEALKRHAVTVVHGLRGAGKTTLAAAYAEKHRGDFRATWWIRAQTESTMRTDLVALGVRLNWVGADAKEQEALAAVLERLRGEGEGLLLMYDNAIDAPSLRPYLPVGGESKALVTSNAHTGAISRRLSNCRFGRKTLVPIILLPAPGAGPSTPRPSLCRGRWGDCRSPMSRLALIATGSAFRLNNIKNVSRRRRGGCSTHPRMRPANIMAA